MNTTSTPSGASEQAGYVPFEALSRMRSIRGGGLPITLADVIDMNTNLIPSLPEEYRTTTCNFINFGWESLSAGTLWYFKRDASSARIVGAVVNDLRDHYTRVFTTVDLVDSLLEECIDWQADVIFFGSTPGYQLDAINAVFARHSYHSPLGFETYGMIMLTQPEKFAEARKAQMKLPDGFCGDSLRHPEDSTYVDKSWTYHNSNSYPTLAESIYSRPSACIRTCSESKTDFPELTNRLVGWEVARSDFSLGSLRVLDSFQKKGFGKWLSIELTAKILDLAPTPAVAPHVTCSHPIPTAFVDFSNTASIQLHAALGYTMLANQLWGWARFNRPGTSGTDTVS